MYTVSHSQLLVPLLLFTIHHLIFSDHLVKVVHLFSGIFMCASNLIAWHAFVNGDDRMSQMGVRQHPRLRMGSVHWQTTMEVVIRRVSRGTSVDYGGGYSQPCRRKRHFRI